MQALALIGAGYCLLFWDDNKPKRESKPREKPTAVSYDELVGAGSIPPNFQSPDFKDAWDKWVQFRAEIKKKLTASTAKLQVKTLVSMGKALAIESIDQSIRQGWQGLFEVRKPQTGWRQNLQADYEKMDLANMKALEEALR